MLSSESSAITNQTIPPKKPFWPQSLELLYLLVLKELRVRYKSSFMGYLWALANPLAYTVVYYFAFRVILRVQIPHFGVYLITGIFPWWWMANTLVQSTGAYRNNDTLIKKVLVPRSILPLSTNIQEMIHFLFALPVLIGAVFFATETFHPAFIPGALIMAVVQLAMIYPTTVILASTNVFVRDIEYLVSILLQMLFFLTPIVYLESDIPPPFLRVLRWNPFLHMVKGWRALLFEGSLDIQSIGSCLAFAAVTAPIAWFTYRKLSDRIGELL